MSIIILHFDWGLDWRLIPGRIGEIKRSSHCAILPISCKSGLWGLPILLRMVVLDLTPPLSSFLPFIFLGLLHFVAIKTLTVLSLPPQQSLTKLLRDPPSSLSFRNVPFSGDMFIFRGKTSRQITLNLDLRLFDAWKK